MEGKNINLEMSGEVFGLLLNAHKRSTYSGSKYYFKGDLCQMSTAQNVAQQFGIHTEVEGGVPFLTSKEDFDFVTQYLINLQIEGWWHYVTHEEYCRIKGEYYFNGKYLCRKSEVRKIADELGIFIAESDTVLYATSKEDYDAIVKQLEE